MRRNNRKSLEEEVGSKRIVYISVGILIIAIMAFAITFFAYSNKIGKQNDTAKSKIVQDMELSSKGKNEVTNPTSTVVGKSVNEMTKEQTNTITMDTQDNTNSVKVAINTSNMQKEETDKVEDTPKKETVIKPVEDPKFAKAIEGEVLKEFAKDTLVYSETLKEWTTHIGVDIKAEKTTVVKASAEGMVKSIKNDPRYGLTIVIEHTNGFSSVYSNLLSSEFIKEGEKVKQGQSIGTVGNTASFEIADEGHLHFEIIKNGEYLDPAIYLK